MKTLARILSLAAIVAMLAGCAGGAPADVTKLRSPPAWTMAAPCSAPKVPQDEGDPAARQTYYIKSRDCHARTRDQARGLQRYVRTIRRQS